ncbi:MAG: beta-ketoacyl synthase chain length factor [Candidatus Protistobacter heckmanni]|nr:beta-ketoacyl synthase chain length factor [Candidatus Protistobacter heckmanni]
MFSLSVLNSAAGVFSIHRGDKGEMTAVASGQETLGYGLLEAYLQYAANDEPPVLLLYADEPADAIYGQTGGQRESVMLAMLIAPEKAGILHVGREAADSDHAEDVATQPDQALVLLSCLRGSAASRWRGPRSNWSWGWDA